MLCLEEEKIKSFLEHIFFGVIPEETWLDHTKVNTDPFESFSKDEARVVKRKFRKLKRLAGVTKNDSAYIMWRKIDNYLLKKGNNIIPQ